jgi:hypothetical protein
MRWSPRHLRMLGQAALVVAAGSLIGLATTWRSMELAYGAVVVIAVLIGSVVISLSQSPGKSP